MIRLILILALTALIGCEKKEEIAVETTSYEKTLQQALILAKAGDVIEIPAGVHEISRGLSLKASGVTIRGVGMDKSVLTFRNQVQGAEGLIITADDIVLEDFAVEDTAGDAIKINECNNLTINRVRTEWTGGPDTENGAYGLYPVQCTNVLIDGAVAIAASDAGIYVGQSDNVIVRNSRAEFNVAGIEIENTTRADVYGNTATNNTGGILVFNMPNLPKPGYGTRVYDNDASGNNTENFALEGTAVAGVPAGSGIMINSNDQVEIFNNRIKNNQTANIIISSFFSTGYTDRSSAESFDPYPEAIYIYDNEFEGGGDSPDWIELKTLKVALYGLTGSFPDVLWDGYYNEELLVDGAMPDEHRICIQNGDAKMLSADGAGEYANAGEVDTNCELPKLPPVELAAGE
jgi:parallel beta-helix repeat protein